jgi:hypothetical protein
MSFPFSILHLFCCIFMDIYGPVHPFLLGIINWELVVLHGSALNTFRANRAGFDWSTRSAGLTCRIHYYSSPRRTGRSPADQSGLQFSLHVARGLSHAVHAIVHIYRAWMDPPIWSSSKATGAPDSPLVRGVALACHVKFIVHDIFCFEAMVWDVFSVELFNWQTWKITGIVDHIATFVAKHHTSSCTEVRWRTLGSIRKKYTSLSKKKRISQKKNLTTKHRAYENLGPCNSRKSTTWS